jgi:hypothetical protein
MKKAADDHERSTKPQKSAGLPAPQKNLMPLGASRLRNALDRKGSSLVWCGAALCGNVGFSAARCLKNCGV